MSFNLCARQEECINPDQGLLTEDDYHKAPSSKSGRQTVCRMCTNQMHRDKTAQNASLMDGLSWDVELAERVNRSPLNKPNTDTSVKLDVGYARGDE